MEDDEEVEEEGCDGGPEEQHLTAEQEGLADDQRQHADVHRVTGEAVRAAGNEPFRRGERCRCPASLEREAGRRLKD